MYDIFVTIVLSRCTA